MKRRLFLLACMATLMVGCASTETVKQAEGQGTRVIYPHAYEAVFNATLAAAKAKELEVLESDRQTGKLLLSHGVTWLSWGERIAVFIKQAGEGSTAVEIVSKPVMAPLNFPPEWDRILHDQIKLELKQGP